MMKSNEPRALKEIHEIREKLQRSMVLRLNRKYNYIQILSRGFAESRFIPPQCIQGLEKSGP